MYVIFYACLFFFCRSTIQAFEGQRPVSPPPSYFEAIASQPEQLVVTCMTLSKQELENVFAAIKNDQSQLVSYSEIQEFMKKVNISFPTDNALKDALAEMRIANVVRCYRDFTRHDFEKSMIKFPEVFLEMFVQKKIWYEAEQLKTLKDERILQIMEELELKDFLGLPVS